MDSTRRGLTKLPCSVSHDTKKLSEPHNRQILSDQTLKVFRDSEEISRPENPKSTAVDWKLQIIPDNCQRESKSRFRPRLKDNTNVNLESRKQKNGLKNITCNISHENSYNEVLALKEAIHAEKKTLQNLQRDLEEERNASSSAAKEAMAMIARLQEEKAAVLMEARQFKRMADERELHNHEALSVLKEMLQKKEEEALVLENEYLITSGTRQLLSPDQSQEQDIPSVQINQSGNMEYENGSRSRVDCGFGSAYKNCTRTNITSYKGFVQGEEGVLIDCTTDDVSHDDDFFGLCRVTPLGLALETNGFTRSFASPPNPRKRSIARVNSAESDNYGEELDAALHDRLIRLEQQFKKFEISDALNVEQVDEDNMASAYDQVSSYETKNNGKGRIRGQSLEAENNRQGEMKSVIMDARHRKVFSSAISIRDCRGNDTHETNTIGSMDALPTCNVMHDVYEVEYARSNHQSARHYTVMDDNINIGNRSGCYEKPDLPSELVISDPIQETSLATAPHQNISSARNMYNSPILSTVSEFNQLICRLQALESERQSTTEVISVLRKENEELKLLQQITRQLQDLKETVQIARVPMKKPSILTFFKGFKSLLPTRGSEKSNASLTSTRNGLSCVLEKTSSDFQRGTRSTVLVKRLKMREMAS